MYASNQVVGGITKLLVCDTANDMYSVYSFIVQPHSPRAPTVWIEEVHESGAKKRAARE